MSADHAALATYMADNPGAVVETVARERGVTPRMVLEALPAQMVRIGGGAAAFVDAMTDIASWGEVTLIVHTDDGIYPLPRPHPQVVLNTMWALDDFTEANGATRVVPGSHLWADRMPTEDETVTIAMPAGSVVMGVVGAIAGAFGAIGDFLF